MAAPTIEVTKEIDARGSFCPGPLMELIRAVRAAKVGDVLAVLSSDGGSLTDIPAWIAKAGQEDLGIQDAGGGVRRFLVRRVK